MKAVTLLAVSSILASGMSFAQEFKIDDLINKESQQKKTAKKDSSRTKPSVSGLDNSKLRSDLEKKLESLKVKSLEARNASLKSTGGSAIGGGNLYSDLVNWCDQGTDILDEARIEAQDTLGVYGDKISAIRTYYIGLIQALEAAEQGSINIHSSITYRTIVRGINLAEYFGILDIVSGDINHSDDKIMDAIYFLDDYYQFILSTTYQLDRQYYLSYYADQTCSNCTDLPSYSVSNLEKVFIDFSTAQITFWIDKFIKYRSDNEGSYSTINIRKAMAGLAYLANETAFDLEESLLNNVFSCQSNQLKRLASRINRYLNQGVEQSLDSAKLTIYKEQIKKIIKNIKQKTCHF